jgi:hypothetical protein
VQKYEVGQTNEVCKGLHNLHGGRMGRLVSAAQANRLGGPCEKVHNVIDNVPDERVRGFSGRRTIKRDPMGSALAACDRWRRVHA